MVALAERKLGDRTTAFPVVEAAPQIMLDPRRGLVALLGRLREQLHDDRGKLRRNVFETGFRRRRLSRDVAVHPLHRFVGGEGKASGERLIEA